MRPTHDRRWFLTMMSRSGVAVAVLGAAACSADGAPTASPSTSGPASAGGAATSSGAAQGSTAPDGELSWERANLGFVSAYVLVRSGEAAVVDTGVTGSADQIGMALQRAGVGWPDVGNVILTHRHSDHVGSVEEVASRAPDATVSTGTDDVAAVPLDGIAGLADGDNVFDLTIIATPGHTPGHISVYDPMTRLLVAGDALTGTSDGSGVLGPNPQFTPEMDTARQSVARLGELQIDTVLFGHGEPFTGDATTAIRAV